MKRTRLALLLFLLCSIVGFWLIPRVVFGDKTVLEHAIDDSCILRVRAEGYWEYCVPVYLEITLDDKKTLTSTTFSCYSPEDIESKTLELEIHKVDNIIFISYEEMPNWILAMVSLEDDLVYPAIEKGDHEEIKRYYAKVQELFSQLKRLLENDELELRR